MLYADGVAGRVIQFAAFKLGWIRAAGWFHLQHEEKQDMRSSARRFLHDRVRGGRRLMGRNVPAGTQDSATGITIAAAGSGPGAAGAARGRKSGVSGKASAGRK